MPSVYNINDTNKYMNYDINKWMNNLREFNASKFFHIFILILRRHRPHFEWRKSKLYTQF